MVKSEISMEFPIISIKTRVRKWMTDQTEKTKSLDSRLVIQVVMFCITIASLLIQGGRILEKQDQSEARVISLINTNEVKRDLKDTIKENDIVGLRAKLEQEISERKESDKKLEKLKELYLVKFGQPILDK